MRDNPTENNHNKAAQKPRGSSDWEQVEWRLARKPMRSTGENQPYLLKIHLAEEIRTTLEKAKTLFGTRTRRNVSELTNLVGDKDGKSTGDQTFRQGTESTQMSRGTRRVNYLGNLWCFAIKDLLFIKILLIFLLIALKNSWFYIFKKKLDFD